MKRCSRILAVCLVTVLAVSGAAVAEDFKPEWLVGTWQGIRQPSQGRLAPVEVRVKSDGTFEGEATAPTFGPVPYRHGKWRIAGNTVIFESHVTAPSGNFASLIVWTLKRNGEDLEGTGLRKTDSFQYPVKLKKGK